jgi:hypothetical protein
MKAIVRFYDISWDTSSDSDTDETDLPAEVIMAVEAVEADVEDGGAEYIQDCGANLLSDQCGWCVNSFKFTFQLGFH